MKTLPGVGLLQVREVYSGAEGRLWELLMGEQIHLGGFQSSMELAKEADIRAGTRGVDLCCASGAGMRCLVRFMGVGQMTGVDATQAMLDLARTRADQEGLSDKLVFVEADVRATGLPSGHYDFVWAEDAWCYVEQKERLVAEAVRLLRPRGKIAFTDWMEGELPMTDEESRRYMGFMRFPSILSMRDYSSLLEANGCSIQVARDTGRFMKQMPLYISMIQQQLTYDALKLINFDTALAELLVNEMKFIDGLASAGKIIQGMIVAEKTA